MNPSRPFDETLLALRLAVGQGILSGPEAESRLGSMLDDDWVGMTVSVRLETEGLLDVEARMRFERDLEFCLVRREDRLFGRIIVVRGHVEPDRVDDFLAEQRRLFEAGQKLVRIDEVIRQKGLVSERARREVLRLRDEILVERFGPSGAPRFVPAAEEEKAERPLVGTTARPRGRRRDCPTCDETVGRKETVCPICASRLHLGVRRRLRLPKLRALRGRILRTLQRRADVLGHEIYPVLQRAAIATSFVLVVLFFFPLGQEGVGTEQITVYAWDLLGRGEPFLAKIYVFSPLLVGLASMAFAMETRRPASFGLGILSCGATPFLLRLFSSPHAYFGAFLTFLDVRFCLVLLLLSGMLVGSFLRIFYQNEWLPRLLGGLPACVVLFFLFVPDLLVAETSYVSFAASRFQRSISEGIFLLVPLLAPLLAAANLFRVPGSGRRLGLATVLLFLAPLIVLYLTLFNLVLQQEVLFFGIFFLRLTGSLLLDFLLVTIGLSFVTGTLIARGRRQERLVQSAGSDQPFGC